MKWYDDIQVKRWYKLLLNAPWNPICALTLSREVAFLVSSPMAGNIIMDLLLEIIAISQALGYNNVTVEEATKQLEAIRGRNGGKGIEPSMLVDVLNGRRMEVETILGNPVKIAKNLGVNTRTKVLVAAFTRSLRDPFVHARNAALLALGATADLFSEDDCATKLLPAICPALVDKEK